MNTLTKKVSIIAFSTILSFSLGAPAVAATTTPKQALRTILGGRAAIGSAILNAKSATTLTVTKDGKTYTVTIDDKTKLRRRFWGKATFDEMQVGDTVNVIGKWTDEAHTTIQARLVRDTSIQKRNGVFIGSVQSLNGSGWVMQTIARGSQTVMVSNATKLANRKGQTIAQGDVTVGHRVRVKGLWDRNANTISEVTHVKDFSLPPLPTKKP